MSAYPQAPTFPVDVRGTSRTRVSRVGTSVVVDIPDGAADNRALAPMPARTLKGAVAAGAPADLAASDAKAILAYATPEVSHTAVGAGSVTRTAAAKLSEVPLSAGDKGAVADGMTDDTAPVAAQLAADPGRRLIVPGTRHLLGGIVIPQDTHVDGENHRDYVLPGDDLYAGRSLYRLGRGTTVALSRASKMSRISVIRNELPASPVDGATLQARINAYQGVGVTVDAMAGVLEDMAIFGHDTGVLADLSQGLGRFEARNLRIDALNGMKVLNAVDTFQIVNPRIYPFLTAGYPFVNPFNASHTLLQKPGTGIYLSGDDSQGHNDFSQIHGGLIYGHAYGLVADNVSNVQAFGLQVDYTAINDNAQVAYLARLGTEHLSLIRCTTVGYPTSVLMNCTPSLTGQLSLEVIGGLFTATGIGFDLVRGDALIMNPDVQSAQTAVKVRATAGTCRVFLGHAGGASGAHVGTAISVEAGFAGLLEIDVPIDGGGRFDQLLDIPLSVWRSGRVFARGRVPWVSYAPVPVATGIAGATATGAFIIIGNQCHFRVQIVMPANSGAGNVGSGTLQFDAPVNLKPNQYVGGIAIGGGAVQCVTGGGNSIAVYAGAGANGYGAGYGQTLNISGVCEIA